MSKRASGQSDRLFEIEQFAKELPTGFLECREMGHPWRPHAAHVHSDGGFERVLRCPRCLTRKVQTLTTSGMVFRSKYVYPEGYQVEGLGQLVGEERGRVRIESMTRYLTKLNQKANRRKAA